MLSPRGPKLAELQALIKQFNALGLAPLIGVVKDDPYCDIYFILGADGVVFDEVGLTPSGSAKLEKVTH